MWVAIATLLAVSIYRAAHDPCTSSEAEVYRAYASHTMFEIWTAPFHPRLGVVYGLLARLAIRWGGVSELTIRIPAILGGLMFWIGLSELCQKYAKGWLAFASFVVLAANPWTFGYFSRATGGAPAVGLLALAVARPRRAGLLAGLAIGSDSFVTVPAVAIGLAALCVWKRSFWKWMDAIAIPALVVAVVIALPSAISRGTAGPASSDDIGTRALLQRLRQEPHAGGTVSVGVSRPLEAGLFFYRRRYHLDWVQIRALQEGNAFDLIGPGDGGLVSKWGLTVIERTGGALLAEPKAR